MKKYYKVLVAIETDDLNTSLYVDADEELDEDDEHELISDTIGDSFDDVFGVKLCDAAPCPAAEIKEYTTGQSFNAHSLVLTPALLRAVRFALNDIPNTKLGLDEFKDTYAIAAALTEAVNEQGVLQ